MATATRRTGGVHRLGRDEALALQGLLALQFHLGIGQLGTRLAQCVASAWARAAWACATPAWVAATAASTSLASSRPIRSPCLTRLPSRTFSCTSRPVPLLATAARRCATT